MPAATCLLASRPTCTWRSCLEGCANAAAHTRACDLTPFFCLQATSNSELHSLAALASTDAGPAFADGRVHVARVSFVAQPTGDALAAALSAGKSFRASGGGGSVLSSALSSGGSLGLMQGVSRANCPHYV